MRTASELGSSPAYVSKRIGILEKTLRVKLFHRSTRRVTVTDDGEIVYQWAQRILEEVEGMASAVSTLKTDPRGVLRISTSFGRDHVAPAISELAKRHAGLEIRLELVDRAVDLIGEGIDIDIRVGEVHEPQLIAHRIAAGSRVLSAQRPLISNGEVSQERYRSRRARLSGDPRAGPDFRRLAPSGLEWSGNGEGDWTSLVQSR